MPTKYGFACILLHDQTWRYVEDLVIDVEGGTFICCAYDLDDPAGDSKESPRFMLAGPFSALLGIHPMKTPPTGSPTRTDGPALDALYLGVAGRRPAHKGAAAPRTRRGPGRLHRLHGRQCSLIQSLPLGLLLTLPRTLLPRLRPGPPSGSQLGLLPGLKHGLLWS